MNKAGVVSSQVSRRWSDHVARKTRKHPPFERSQASCCLIASWFNSPTDWPSGRKWLIDAALALPQGARRKLDARGSGISKVGETRRKKEDIFNDICLPNSFQWIIYCNTRKSLFTLSSWPLYRLSIERDSRPSLHDECLFLFAHYSQVHIAYCRGGRWVFLAVSCFVNWLSGHVFDR